MFDELDRDSNLKQMFELCTRLDTLGQLKHTNDTLDRAFVKRDIDMSERDLAPSFKQLRDKIYIALKSLVRMINDMIRMETINDKYVEAKHLVYNYLNPKRANWLQQCTKRRLRREKMVQHKEPTDSYTNIDFCDSYGFVWQPI